MIASRRVLSDYAAMKEMEKKPSLLDVIDPKGTLPLVNLMPVGQPNIHDRYTSQAYVIITERINIIGRILCGRYKNVGDCKIVSDNESAENYFMRIDVGENRRKGFGIAAYLQAINRAHENGYSFRTQKNSVQSEDAKRVWEKLAIAGIARVIEPFRMLGPECGAYEGEYEGHYTVEPPEA